MRHGEGGGWSRLSRAEDVCREPLPSRPRRFFPALLPKETWSSGSAPSGETCRAHPAASVGLDPLPPSQHSPAPSRCVIPSAALASIPSVSAKRDREKLGAGQEIDAGRDKRQGVHQKIAEDVPSRNSCLKVYLDVN